MRTSGLTDGGGGIKEKPFAYGNDEDNPIIEVRGALIIY